MGIYAIPVSLLLFGVILVVELQRKKSRSYVDFLFVVNAMFALLFCIIPLFLVISSAEESGDTWLWMSKNRMDDTVFFLASLVSLAGYVAVVFGYYFNDLVLRRTAGSDAGRAYFGLSEGGRVKRQTQMLVLGLTLGIIGASALFFYAHAIGGVRVMILFAAAFRDSESYVVTKYAFLKNVAPCVIVSSYFFFALAQTSYSSNYRIVSKLFFFITFLLSLLILFHQSGRLYLFAYFIIFPLAMMVKANRFNIRYIIAGGLLFFVIILLGKEGFHYFIDPDSMETKISGVFADPLAAIALILREFSFPFITLANTIKTVPVEIEYRWFVDVPLSVVYLLPQRLLNLEDLPLTVSMLNSGQFNAPIPVDLVSFGYFSMGLPGVILTCFIYGVLMRVFDALFPENSDPMAIIFRVAWILFFAFNVMYGNPHHALVDGFALIVATTLILIFKMQHRRKRESYDTCTAYNYGS